VYDVNYTALNHKITTISRTQSNGSTTGIASMLNAVFWSRTAGAFGDMVTKSKTGNSAPEMIDLYSRGASAALTAPFAGQTEARPALAIQSRMSKVVSSVPKAAIWLLVLANLLFALFALVLTVCALRATLRDRSVHQVQTRLNIAGLAAQLFEGKHAREYADDEDNLFEERDGRRERLVKRVTVEPTVEGGAAYVLGEAWEE